MQTYNEYRPTVFDNKGAFLRAQGNWLVVPVIRTRDSGPLAESNFETALQSLGGESDNVEVHRFGHWGPGWFEIIIVKPESEQAAIAVDLENALADYPVLDDADYSEREWNEIQQAWDTMDVRERAPICAKHGISIFAARRDEIPQDLPYYDDIYTAYD